MHGYPSDNGWVVADDEVSGDDDEIDVFFDPNTKKKSSLYSKNFFFNFQEKNKAVKLFLKKKEKNELRCRNAIPFMVSADW